MQASSPQGRDRAQEMGRPEMQQEQPSWNSCRGAFACMLSCFSQSVQLLSRVQLFATPWTAAHHASLSITNSWSVLKFMSIELVMPSNHLILCHPVLPPSIFPPSIFPSIGVFSNESVLRIKWPKYWSFSFSIKSFQ